MIQFSCERCTLRLRVKDEFAGKSARCPTCGQAVRVPMLPKPAATPEHIDGQASSLDRAGVDPGVTLAQSNECESKPSRREVTTSRYTLQGEIARGGMGAVLKAFDRDIRREVALKYMLDEQDAKKKSRFVEEAQITGQLEHPNIVPVHELGVDSQQRLFFTMKMVKGKSLDDILKSLDKDPTASSHWTLGRLINVFVGICNALAYAHSRGVIHRDLKPANIMVGDFGEVYVMDWGLAKVLGDAAPVPAGNTMQASAPSAASDSPAPSSGSDVSRVRTSQRGASGEADLTQDGSILGTPAYMAPEQARGEIHSLDQRSDIYSLGGLLYALLTLKTPVEKTGDYMALLLRVAEGEIKRPEVRTPNRQIPPELSAIAMKALSLHPSDRYPTVEALRRDVELFQEGRSVSAKQDTFREQVWKLIKRNQGASVATATAALVLLLLSGFFLTVNYWARRQAEDNYTEYLREAERRRGAIPSFLTAAKLLLDRRDFEGAGAQARLVLELDPENIDARWLRGQLAVIKQDFVTARTDLEACVRQRPNDALAQELLRVTTQFKPKEEATALVLAEVFSKHQAFTLADGAVRALGENVPAARDKLLKLYRERIEKTWPGRGEKLIWAADGVLALDLSGSPELNDLSPLRGIPLTVLIVSQCPRLFDLSPLKGLPLTSLNCEYTAVSDLSPLKDTKLTQLRFAPGSIKQGLDVVRTMPSLKSLGVQEAALYPAAEFWARYDKGEFKK